MAEVRWKLKEALERYDTNPYALARAMGDQSKAVTLYRLTSPTKKTSRIDLGTLGAIITGLRELTGKPVELTDLLEVVDSPENVSGAKTGASPSWQSLTGIWDDPDSPGDVAARHDHYLALAAEEDLERKRGR